MELRVLGPLEVVQDDLSRPMGGRRQRALLADLIVHANRVVSVDRLIEDVWEGKPPATAHHALQVYVSRLRTTLREDGIQIALRVPGYELDVDEDRLDLSRFEHLVADGRRA
ncbi:MAG TPA: winged helix-turn-helix domain-containing protein, partial [Actinomycetota bacterium]|nr:winged helix-turn-helix domain-containing protein [Actinomycetota bacterium]